MASNCIDINAINRSGSSREQRVLKALLPAFARLDERSHADLILFAKRYAKLLNYYNEDNAEAGNWQAIMSMDISVTLAGLAKIDVTGYAAHQKRIYNNIKVANSDFDRVKLFKTLFDFIFSVVIELDDYYRTLPPEAAFKEYFSSTIKARLQTSLQAIFSYYQGFVSLGYIDSASEFIPPNSPVPVTLAQHFDPLSLSAEWQGSVTPIELSVPSPGDIGNSIYHIITHNVFNAQVDIILKTLSNITSQSASFLEATLTNFPSHTPHYALYITFLHLFKKAQEQLNLFTGRHLDFYYKDVLRLQTKEAVPDSVHLLPELQKGIEQHRVQKNTVFKGGKDIDGIEISYAADEETVIKRAVVKSLYSLYVQQNSAKGKPFENVFASPVANSDDGQGTPITRASKDWFAFGDPAKVKEAALGFAVASHYLYLNEATRTITLKLFFSTAPNIFSADLLHAFTVQLTGKKGWFDVAGYTVEVNNALKTIAFTLVLEGDAPPIVAYTEKVHKETYATDLPVIRFLLKNVRGSYNPYKLLKSLSLNKIGVETKVSGLKDVILQNDEGALNPSKPFTPFGSQPKVGSAMMIGSKEIFQKQLTALSIVVDWDDVPDSILSQLDEALKEYERTLSYIDMRRKFHSVKVSALNKGRWVEIDDRKGIFIEDNLYNEIFDWTRPDYKYARKLSAADIEHAVINVTASGITPNERNYDKNEAYSTTSIDGFIKLELNYPDFGHSAYPEALRNAAQNVTVTVTGSDTNMTMSVKPASTLPKPPYTPTIKSLSINYTAATDIELQLINSVSFEGKQGNFYHLAPFGYARINKSLQTPVSLLPVYDNEGELFVGFENVIPGSTLKVLFQVADGTSNPLKQENKLEWFYLSSNSWLPFPSTDVIDATKNFTQSGIVTFILPSTINTGNTLFDATLSWIKVLVAKDTDAVCNLVNIHAQAIKATLVSDAVKGIHFKQLLPPDTVSKLLVADAAIKKISQPYESFGGQAAETSERFYTRVSERLRHKQRAITAWDYERIILEQFPAVYRAKCINHAGLIPGKTAGESKYSETAPGYVTIVTVPDLRQNSFKNPLKPYTSIGLLTNIKDHLKKLTSPFVKLFVLNPKFEEVQFQFNVVITAPLDENFYVKQLSMDIEMFLCPWAYNVEGDVSFGGKISKSVVLNFIEERPYVDFVTCFKMHHYIDRGTAGEIAFMDIEEAETSTGISILVSYFDDKTNTRHLIEPGKKCEC